MDTRVLTYFLTVAREENITRAAEILRISQPSLSRQIMQLEEELGLPLFIRGNKNVRLTPEGLLFKSRAEEILALVDKTREELLNEKEYIAGDIYIGTMESEAFLPLAGLSPEQPAIQKLLNMAVFSRDLPSFLQALTLGQESDLMRSSGGKTYASGTVTLMTLHGSKGLEFPVVFLCGVNQGVLPLESPRHPCDTEEERRLFFVGMTRAKQELILLTSGHESPFLKEIPPEALQVAPASTHVSKPQQLSLF